MRGARLPLLRASIGGGCVIVADLPAMQYYLCHAGGLKTAGNPLLNLYTCLDSRFVVTVSLSVHGGVMFELERESAPIGHYDDWMTGL